MANVAILSYYSGVVERGVETFAYEVAMRLQDKHKVTVFQTGSSNIWAGSKKNPLKLKIQTIKFKKNSPKPKVGILGKIYLDWSSLKILIFTLLCLPSLFKEKFNIIIPLNGGLQTAILRVFSKITHSKILISGHAGIGADDAWNLFWRPDAFVALTTAQVKWAKKLVPEVAIETIPNGVDLSRFNPKVKPKILPLTKPIAICTSALDPYKRVDLTIKAVSKTKNMSLLVLGDGEMRGQIDTLGKRLLGKRYLRLVVPHREIPGYYRSCQVFTLASKTEAFGISYVEAMACNLPIVTTSDDSRAEIVGRAGILTNTEDIDQYGKDLQIAVRTNYRNIPYDQAAKFSWNKIVIKYSNLISKVTGR